MIVKRCALLLLYAASGALLLASWRIWLLSWGS
jgi:hypothetical protein